MIVLLVILLPSPGRKSSPSFSQWISGPGMAENEHTSTNLSPSVCVMGVGNSTMVGRAVGDRDNVSSCWENNSISPYCKIECWLEDFDLTQCPHCWPCTHTLPDQPAGPLSGSKYQTAAAESAQREQHPAWCPEFPCWRWSVVSGSQCWHNGGSLKFHLAGRDPEGWQAAGGD